MSNTIHCCLLFVCLVCEASAFKCLAPTLETLNTGARNIPDDATDIDTIIDQHLALNTRYEHVSWYFLLKLPQSEHFLFASEAVEELRVSLIFICCLSIAFNQFSKVGRKERVV